MNWFRQDAAGRYLWPGYGENLRVLCWIIERCKGAAQAHDSVIGQLPHAADLDTRGLELAPGALEELLRFHRSSGAANSRPSAHSSASSANGFPRHWSAN